MSKNQKDGSPFFSLFSPLSLYIPNMRLLQWCTENHCKIKQFDFIVLFCITKVFLPGNTTVFGLCGIPAQQGRVSGQETEGAWRSNRVVSYE